MFSPRRRKRSIRKTIRQSIRIAKSKSQHRRGLFVEALEHRRMMALLGVVPDYPLIDYDSGGTVAYNAAADLFLLDATPTLYTESSMSDQGFFNTFTSDIKISIQVDGTGTLIGGILGPDLIITGEVDTDGVGGGDFSGVLLTGEITDFGFQNSGSTTDLYDFRFTITGGALAIKYAGEDFGVVTISENSNFTGVFTSNFGGNAKGQGGAIDQEEAFKTGRKYHDLNADGDDEAGDERDLSGWTIAAFRRRRQHRHAQCRRHVVRQRRHRWQRRLQPDAHARSAVHHRRASLRSAGLVREPGRRHGVGQHVQCHLRRVRLRRHARPAARPKAATTSATARTPPRAA